MGHKPIRTAVRAIIVEDDRLLLVNAYAHTDKLWCAPGGGVEPHASLPDNLAREVHEETGLTVSVGAPALINEFHEETRNFHQIDIFFRCTITGGQIEKNWKDPEGVVRSRRFFSRKELENIILRPKILPEVAFSDSPEITYDPLETLLRL